MFAQVHIPEALAREELDGYLEQGWFRMGQTIFTTNFLLYKSRIYSTVWLRISLRDYSDPGEEKLFRRNAAFRTELRPATLTTEHEQLYARYRESVPFQASKSLHDLLFSDRPDAVSIFQTFEVAVYDGDALVACGFFDMGEASAQGIISFYNPAYKKFSLGKYLIYLKIRYCRDQQLSYFYPGYFVPGNPHFDYKLSIGRAALQFLDLRTSAWLPISAFSYDTIAVDQMHRQLLQLQALLEAGNVDCKVVKYEFFDVNLMPSLRGNDLFDVPYFLHFGSTSEDNIVPLIIFDVRDGLYHLQVCPPAWKPKELNPDTEFYSAFFLGTAREITSAPEAEEMSHRVIAIIKSQS